MSTTFTPVLISRGRKFRGKAYFLGDVRCGSFGNQNAKLWDPAAKRYVWANVDFCDEDESVTPEQVATDKEAYSKAVIEDTIKWCRECKSGAPEDEVMQFARNVLRKYHPEIDESKLVANDLGDRRDLSIEVEKTLNWAIQLTTRPCWMYGHYCKGGRPLPTEKKIRIAYKSLTKKGLTQKADFEAVWTFLLSMMGLAQYAKVGETNG